MPQECAWHVPFAQAPLRELARCDIPDTLLLRSAGFLVSARFGWGVRNGRLVRVGGLALPQERARHVPFAQTPLRELARCDIPDTLLLRSAGLLVGARFGEG